MMQLVLSKNVTLKKITLSSKITKISKSFCLKIRILWTWKDINKNEKVWQYTLEIKIYDSVIFFIFRYFSKSSICIFEVR